MGFFHAKATVPADWHQRLTLASEFELSMAGFGLMGDPGNLAERLILSEVPSNRDADRRVTAERPLTLAEAANACASA